MLNDILSGLFSSDIPGFTFSMLIPLLFLSAMIKNQRSRHIILYFCWGLFAVVFAYILNEWFSGDTSLSAGLTSDIAPIVEETLTALPLLLFFRRRDGDDPNLIIYCAMASGIGFSVQETLYYFTSFTADPGLFSLFPLLVRTATTCLMHGMSTAVIGFGIVITSRYKGIRIPMILGLLSLAATIHSLYNILIGTRLAIIALLMPAVLYFTGLALLSGDDEEPEGGPENES
ncbi:MAG: PrsW family intramembrane metalloprotease [Peptococcaceae bacterium]|nr:PrsW family intramembrane metalloprotease [Peptococcaceae bacterium]